MYRSGSVFTLLFTTDNGTANADSLPTAKLAHNGTDDNTVTLVVANLDAGRYKVSGTIPLTYVAGDSIAVTVSATISSVSTKQIVLNATIDLGIDFTQVVPTSNDPQTVGDALNAARAMAFGNRSLIGTVLNYYAPDASTIVHSYLLNSAIAPTLLTSI